MNTYTSGVFDLKKLWRGILENEPHGLTYTLFRAGGYSAGLIYIPNVHMDPEN